MKNLVKVLVKNFILTYSCDLPSLIINNKFLYYSLIARFVTFFSFVTRYFVKVLFYFTEYSAICIVSHLQNVKIINQLSKLFYRGCYTLFNYITMKHKKRSYCLLKIPTSLTHTPQNVFRGYYFKRA